MNILYCPGQMAMDACSSSAKIWGWAVTRRMCLNGSTIPTQGPTPDAKLAAMGPNQLASSFRWWSVKASPTMGESCIVLQSGPARSLIATFPQCSVITCSTRILCCRGRKLRTRPQTGVCEPLMPDVVVLKVHQNNHSYVSSVDLQIHYARI